jgi:hypothetical protein
MLCARFTYPNRLCSWPSQNVRFQGKVSLMRIVWISGLTALLLFASLAWYLQPLNPGVLVLQFAFTPRMFGEVIHFWSPADLIRYRNHLLIDFVLLAAYGVFGYVLTTRAILFSACTSLFRAVIKWLLPAAACFDALENTLHWWLTETPRFGVTFVYTLAAGTSVLKWLFILAFGVLCAYAAIRAED